MEKTNINKLLIEFFEKRFKRSANEEDTYFQTWKSRFGKGLEIAKMHMDLENLKIFNNLIKDFSLD